MISTEKLFFFVILIFVRTEIPCLQEYEYNMDNCRRIDNAYEETYWILFLIVYKIRNNIHVSLLAYELKKKLYLNF